MPRSPAQGRAVLFGFVLGAGCALAIRPFDLADERCSVAVDRHGVRLGRVGRSGCVSTLQLSDLPDFVVPMLLHSEDRRFFEHGGVDLLAAASAARDALRGSPRRGASTLTMQLGRLLKPQRDSRGVGRKLAEVGVALRLERTLSKQAVLEGYLRLAPLGRGIIGLEAAAEAYFGKSPSELTFEEAALVVGLLPAPARLDPRFGLARACARRDALLERLATLSPLEAQAQHALTRPCLLTPRRSTVRHAPHALRQLPSVPGPLTTTLDSGLQGAVEAVLSSHTAVLRQAGASQASLVVLDSRTSEVLALVGSLDFDGPADGQLDGTRLPRQTGSALKPFLYAEALATGYSMQTLIDDVEADFVEEGRGGTTFTPRNADGEFHGRMPLSEALARSRNVPAVRLTRAVGPERLAAVLREFGLSPLRHPPAWYGLGMALGTAEARLLELTAAYATLGRGGLFLPATLLPQSAGPMRIADAQRCTAVVEALRDEGARERAFGPSARLGFTEAVAIKTGTSPAARDLWLFAVTSERTLGLWAGNFDATAGAPDAVAMVVLAPLARQVLWELGTR